MPQPDMDFTLSPLLSYRGLAKAEMAFLMSLVSWQQAVAAPVGIAFLSLLLLFNRSHLGTKFVTPLPFSSIKTNPGEWPKVTAHEGFSGTGVIKRKWQAWFCQYTFKSCYCFNCVHLNETSLCKSRLMWGSQ